MRPYEGTKVWRKKVHKECYGTEKRHVRTVRVEHRQEARTR